MFKVGDKIIRIGTNYLSVETGKTYVVSKIKDIFRICLEGYDDHGFSESLFILYKKKELNNEVDFLNAFQQNFKEGI